ncbi:3-oxoacyl-[acyl-carrier-protein] synthase III C-terminal domain-containing protein [Streptomyces sp. NPDC041003]|uniref:3-oxoacyl-ACP synthase III family protein n=1 Tax=Streptomyces sp. NPDC041003 TaxID=3155730 RepID=UPI0033D4D85D
MLTANGPRYSRFEAFGRRLPSLERTTEEVVSGTPLSARALLMLTGIQRRLACDVDAGECAEQLALAAARDCLSKSRYDAADLDVVISSAIFRSDEHRRLSFEPSVASVIAREIGSTTASCFDVSNACAGMFTGILLLDRMIKAGTIRRGMVVSGEHASLITGSARQEITGLRDLQLASLTVGDAGMAVIVDESTDAADRIHAFEMTTSGAYASLCKAMPSDETAGLVMHTDSARQQAAERMQIGVSLTEDVYARSGRTPADPGFAHSIYHQNSVQFVERVHAMAAGIFHPTSPEAPAIVQDFGNTGSTSQLLTFYEHMQRGTISPGDTIAFAPSGSGIVIGHLSTTITHTKV